MADDPETGSAVSNVEPLSYARPLRIPRAQPIERACRRALVCGWLFFLTPIPAFAAIIYGIIGIERTRSKPQRGRRAAITGIVLGSVGILGWVYVIVTAVEMRHHMLQIQTCSEMRQLGSAIYGYSVTHQGRYPDGWEDLIATGMINAKQLVSPAGGDTPARGATTQAVLADLKKPGHCSYLYFGKGLRHPKRSEAVMIACDLDSFRQTGKMVALYADGHVDILPRAIALRLLQEHLSAAASQPATQATTQP